jgi:hypothetical protein
MNVIGYANIKSIIKGPGTRCGDDTQYLGKRLRVIERTEDGDCLVINADESGIGDISAEDIESYQPIVIPKTGNVLFDQLMQMVAGRL